MLKTAIFALTILLLAGLSSAQVQVGLTATRTNTALPDGKIVPMWGLSCTPVVAGTCAPANATATANAWSPVLITVPAGQGLRITLTNTLPAPTSLVIVGQINGGGLGLPTRVPSPAHAAQTVTTWPGNASASFTPPSQLPRAESFVAETPAATTAAPSSQTYTWSTLAPGTYLIESGTHPSIQVPMGLYGVVVVTQPATAAVPPTPATPAMAYPPSVPYDADQVILLSEIDPAQNAAVDAVAASAVAASGVINESLPWSISCAYPTSGATAPTCYPPAVNYTPMYYLVNGQSFNKWSPSSLTVPVSTTAANGILLRFVNAGLHMHVPSLVGLDMSLMAEDGHLLPGIPKVQNEVFLAASKVYDVLVRPAQTNGAYNAATYPIFDRELSLTANNQPDSGMQTVLALGGATPTAPSTPLCATASTGCAINDAYSVSPGATITGNVLSNDINVSSAMLNGGPTNGGTVTLNADGTFTYTAPKGLGGGHDTFTYVGNNGATNTATVTITVAGLSVPNALADIYTSNNAATIQISSGLGVLANDSDPAGYALTAVYDACPNTAAACLSPTPTGGGTGVNLNADGSFTASVPTSGTYSFYYHALNSQNSPSTSTLVTLTFPAGNGPKVTVQDAQNPSMTISDYTWVMEEDDTLHQPSTGITTGTAPILATSFHTAHMRVIATGCTGPVSCENGQTVYDNNPLSTTYQTHIPVAAKPITWPTDAVLDRTKYYYISVLPGDAANPFINAGGAPATNPDGTTRPFNLAQDCPTATDYAPGTGSCGHTIGGAEIAPNTTATTVLVEPSPLPTAQLSVFVFEDNNPTNGDIDGVEEQQGLGGFQIILNDVAGATGDPTGQMTYDMFNMPLTNSLANATDTATGHNMCPITSDPSNLMGMIITCPALEDDGKTPSPVAGQALIKNLFPNRFDVLANPGAAREAAGENWIQVSTLEGTRANDAFAKAGEPAYFQEFGAPGFHSFIGFVNPDHIKTLNATLAGNNTITGKVTMLHMTRPVDPKKAALYDSGSYETLAQTHCYVGLNSQNGSGPNIAFAECDPQGNFTLTGVPVGTYQLVVWDQWLDQIIDYKTVTVPSGSSGVTVAVGDVPVFSWFTRVETSEYLDLNKNGVRDVGEPGLSQIPMRIRYRDGAISNFLPTDTDGNAPFDELFPLFNWYVIESDTTRYKGTGVHIAVDGGGAVSTDPLYPGVLSSTYPCDAGTGCPSSVRTDPGTTLSEGIQSFISESILMDWGKTQYAVGENGGIVGHVIYASTRPFDDPTLGFQNTWEPLVPRVTVNLYRETTAPDGSVALTKVDSTTTSSWDDYVNTPGNMSCPGQLTTDPFFTYTLGTANQYKCYDGFHNWNQAQPAPFDGQYVFPTTACSVCTANPATSDPISPNVLPAGKYVVEVVVPTGYEIVKEEDKNILIGDAYIAPVTQQFAGLGNVFILPDQAAVNSYYNANNVDNATTNLGRTSFANFGPGGVGIMNTPCMGQMRIVPDYLSLYPGSGEVAPFAGAMRPLCDRREVTLEDQMATGADFLIFTKTPIASHFTGMILDDASSEFNTASPDFGEKFAVPFVPVSFRDFNGVEVGRVYSDQFGMFNGLVFSTWAVNPPNPTGYAPNMMITCMNDPGPIPDPNHPGQLVTDPLYNPAYSNFCYTNSFMPGVTDYMDTPVLPVSAFASGYNPADCAYPDATPAVSRVDGSDAIAAGGFGPWLSTTGSGHTLTITALGDLAVPNNAYGGPGVTTGIGSQKTINRHYGFGNTAGTVQLLNSSTGTVAATLNTSGTGLSWADNKIIAGFSTAVATGSYELSITAANGKKSIDAVTITIGGSTPTFVNPPATNVATGVGSGLPHPIQDAIDKANPGDLIILNGAVNAVPAGGTANCTLNNIPSVCAAGMYPELVIMSKPLRLQGVGAASVIINAAKYPTQKLQDWRTRINNLFGFDMQGNSIGPAQVDPLPGQEITGGVVLLEPSVLSTEEGAGITVLARNIPGPTNGRNSVCSTASPNYSVSNFNCAPSRIDGITITGGDAGGAIYVNGWAHNLEIANNRIYGNAGPFSGGVRIGQPYLEGQSLPVRVNNSFAGFGYDNNVNIHHNKINSNGTVEANNGEAGGGGGVSICSGTDNYKVNYNFICGNFSLGDGGGIGHVGLSQNGTIANNWVLFNQVFNQSATTSGGGIVVEGEPSTLGGLTIGTGNLTIDSNLVQGNHAQGGHGGGIRLQSVNGAEISGGNFGFHGWRVTVTNNMIVDNVAGWAGGGMSLSDTVSSSILYNTIVSNDSTATVGDVFTTACTNGFQNGTGPTTSCAQPAGISSEMNSPALCAALASAAPPMRCTGPAGHPFSNPTLEGDIIYQNRSFYFTAGPTSLTTGQTQTGLVPNLTTTTSTYSCPSGAKYWDLGVLGQMQTGATLLLNPMYSVLTPGDSGYSATNQLTNPSNVQQYCNGARTNPGIPDADPSAPPVQFTMQAAGTEDEGGNWIDVRYGPLSLSDSSQLPGSPTYNMPLGNYHLAAGSPAIDAISLAVGNDLGVTHDFDGQSRPSGCGYDEGADELYPSSNCLGTAAVSPASLTFGNQLVGTESPAPGLYATVSNTGTGNLGNITISITGNFVRNNSGTTNNCPTTAGFTLAAGANCRIYIRFAPTAAGVRSGTLTVTSSDPANPSLTVSLSGTGVAAPTRTPNSLSFGTVTRGQTSTSQFVTLTNPTANPVTLAINSITFTGTNFADFHVVQGATNNCGGSLSPGSNCRIYVVFAPPTTDGAGGKFATMNINDSFTGIASLTQTVSLSGTAR